MGMGLRWPRISRRVLGTQSEQGGATTAARASTGQCPAAPPQGTCRMVAGGPNAGGTSQAPSSEVPKFSRGLRGIEQLGPTWRLRAQGGAATPRLAGVSPQGDDGQEPLEVGQSCERQSEMDLRWS